LAINRLFNDLPLGPEDIRRLAKAYESVLVRLRLADRADPITELVARRIFETWQRGIVDAGVLARVVIEEFGSQSDSRTS
jgi:hypothetical protein